MFHALVVRCPHKLPQADCPLNNLGFMRGLPGGVLSAMAEMGLLASHPAQWAPGGPQASGCHILHGEVYCVWPVGFLGGSLSC